jgi:hypothetical protein
MPRRNFRELEAKMTPAQIAERDAHVKQMLAKVPLTHLRAARNLRQHLANLLNKDRSAIS